MGNVVCSSCGKAETGFLSNTGEEVCRVCYYSVDTKAADERASKAKTGLFWTGVVVTPIGALGTAGAFYWVVEQNLRKAIAALIVLFPLLVLRYGINALRQGRS